MDECETCGSRCRHHDQDACAARWDRLFDAYTDNL